MRHEAVEPFDWAGLPQVTAEHCERRRRIALGVRAEISRQALANALALRLGEAVTVQFGPWLSGSADLPEPVFALQLPQSGWVLRVAPEPDLARLGVSRLLSQPYEVGAIDAPFDPALWGASAALVLDLARHCVREGAPILRLAPSDVWQSVEHRLMRRGTVRVAGRAYRLDVAVDAPEATEWPRVAASCPPGGPGALEALGSIALRIPWVVAVSSARLSNLAGLSSGDVWLPGAAFYRDGEGFCARASAWRQDALLDGCLVAAGAEWGWPVSGRAGHFILGQALQRLPLHGEPEVEVDMAEDRSGLGEVLGQAQVLVRVELGAVEMRASQWAQLRPGDVVATGRAVGAAVQLRAGGELLAEGHLVQVDGQLGVRVERIAGDSCGGMESVGTSDPGSDPSKRDDPSSAR